MEKQYLTGENEKIIMRLFLKSVAILITFFVSELSLAAPILLPSGLTLDPPDEIDLTYQTIPSFDESEKVIAGWNGEKLQYFFQ